MYPHRIRLRGPWECEPLTAGRVRFRRRFGYPGQIDTFERVWLTFAGVEGVADVTLNGTLLGRGEGTFEYEVTALLRPRNELTVEVEEAGSQGEVAMEVRCTAFLRGVRAWSEGALLHVAGEVVGHCERALDLYVLRERSTVMQATVEAVAEGRPFHLQCEAERPEAVRVELVNGAVVWFMVEAKV